MSAGGPHRRKSMSALMSAIEVLSGLVVLTMSFVVNDPLQTSCLDSAIGTCAWWRVIPA
jgi:hypothetical protein